MPGPLANPRHEAFAQALAKGMTADAAYQEAGYRPHRGNAATLRANQSIRDRVAELTAAAAERAEITKADVLRGLLREAQMLAEDDKPNGARVAAWRLIGLELGMFAEKRQHDVSDNLADLLLRDARPLPVGLTPPPRPETETRH